MNMHVTQTPAALLAESAREGLRMVAKGEHQTMAGWLMYGAALNDGRKLFASDEQFGAWVRESQLDTHDKMDRAAAIWAAADQDAFSATRKGNPRVRTVRGLHAKWKQAQQPQPEPTYELPTEDELRVVQKLEALVNHPSTDAAVRVAAERKLETYTARFGEIKAETPKQLLTKKELATAVTKQALVKASRNQKAFEIIEYAIRVAYGSTDGHLERVLEALKKC